MMLDLFRRKFVFLSRVAALLYTIAICVMSLMPPGDVPLERINDKYRHALAYGLFAVLLGCSFLNLRWRTVPMAFVVATLFGVGMEFVQPFFGRTRDVMDAVANATGAAVGCVILIGLASVYLKLRREERIRSFSGRPEPRNGF
jgi:VanZ family protein